MEWHAAFSLGILIGLIVLVTVRVDYYEVMGHQPEMHPGIAYMFLPIIFAILYLPALALEYLLRKVWFAPHHWVVSALIGATHAFLLSWWSFPDHM
jgi:hypothetical protein